MRDPRRRVQLDDEGVCVAVEDEAGKAVVLAVEHPIPVSVVADHGASFDGRADALLPEGRVDVDRLAGMKDPNPYRRARIPQPDGDEVAIVVEDHREVANRAAVADRRDRFVEHPRMTGGDLAAGVRGDANGHSLVPDN